MAFRTVRQRQYNYLRDRGFLKFEAQVLSKIPRKVPYMPDMVRGRAQIWARAKKESWSEAKYERYINAIYKKKGWTTLTRSGKTVLSPWAMLRAQENRYKDKHPDYKSPWIRKLKQWRDFQSKYEAGIEKYPRGAAYKSKAQEAKRKQ